MNKTTTHKKPGNRVHCWHCDCTHPDALTCLAEKHQTTRFNAMILFGKAGEYGRCTCACHRKARTA